MSINFLSYSVKRAYVKTSTSDKKGYVYFSAMLDFSSISPRGYCLIQ